MKVTKIPGFGNYGIYIDHVNFETLLENTRAALQAKAQTEYVICYRLCSRGPSKGYIHWRTNAVPACRRTLILPTERGFVAIHRIAVRN